MAKPTWQRSRRLCGQIEAEKFNGSEMPTDKLPIQDGNDKGYDGWTDNVIISAANKKRPVIVGRQRQPVAEGDLDSPVSGDYVNVVLDLWGMNNNYGKRIIASLEAVQYAAKGEPFVASSPSTSNLTSMTSPAIVSPWLTSKTHSVNVTTLNSLHCPVRMGREVLLL